MESAEACKTTTNIEDNMTNLRANDLTGEWVDGWIDNDEFTVGVAPTTQLVVSPMNMFFLTRLMLALHNERRIMSSIHKLEK